MARGGMWHVLVLVYTIFRIRMNTAQIFIGDTNVPGILYASLPEPRDDTNIMDTLFNLIPLPENSGINGIDYDPGNKMVYWNDFNMDRISRIQLDGTNQEVILSTNSRLFYYTKRTELGVTNLDGSGNRTIKVFSTETTGSSLSKYGSRLFWSAQSRSTTSYAITSLINEYDMKSSTLTIHNSTVTLTSGNDLAISPVTTRIISNTPYNEPVAIQGCPDNIVVTIDDNASNAPSISWTEPVLNSWSSCPTMVFLGPGTDGGDFPLGITELSYRASDAAGNTDDCQFSVTVRRSSADETLPPTTGQPTTGQPTTGQPTTGQPSGSTALVTSCSSVLLVLCIALFLIVLK
eukprot:XP_011673777.1 PREDICTED: hyalin-like [Strongylocentrotus purpuratus]